MYDRLRPENFFLSCLLGQTLTRRGGVSDRSDKSRNTLNQWVCHLGTRHQPWRTRSVAPGRNLRVTG